MSKTVTNYQTGLKYSFRPHGLRSRVITVFSAFVVAFGGALLAVSPADAVTGPVYVTVCGNSNTWYVNPDETAREPLGQAGGLVFGPTDLIHHAFTEPVSALQPGSYVASPAPDQPSFFSVEVANPDGAYGTLRWDGTNWSIVIAPGAGATDGTFTDPSPVNLLAGKVTKWGAFNPASDQVISFGVGYTQNPPGTVTTLISQVTFQGTAYNLSCPVPVPSTVTVTVPGPTQTVIQNHTVVVQAPAPPAPSPSNTAVIPPLPSPSPSITASPTTDPVVAPAMSPASGNGGVASSLWKWALLVAIVCGLILLLLGLLGRRRRKAYQGAHSVDNTQTQMIPAIHDDDKDYYSVGDYAPVGGFNPKLGGWPGESYAAAHSGQNAQTEQLPIAEHGATVEAPPVKPDESTPDKSGDGSQTPPVE